MLMKASSLSLTEQLAGRFAERIRNRLLAAGTRLPSVRQCAQQHGVSPSTVVAAYDKRDYRKRCKTGTGRCVFKFRGDLQVSHEIVEPLRGFVQAARLVPGDFAPADHPVTVPHPGVRVLRWQQGEQ